MVYFFSCFDIFYTVFIGPGQVFKEQLDRFDGHRRGKLGGIEGDCGFQGVGQGIYTGICGKLCRHIKYQVAVADGDIRGEGVVRDGVLDSRFIIGDDCKWGNL